MTPDQIATAFSGHRFGEAYPHLAPSLRWVLVGGPTLVGSPAVVEACAATATGLAGVSTEFTRFLVTTGSRSTLSPTTRRPTAR